MLKMGFLRSISRAGSSLRFTALLLLSYFAICEAALGQQKSASESLPSAEQIVRDWRRIEDWDASLRSYRAKDNGVYTFEKEKEPRSYSSLVRRQPNYRLLRSTQDGRTGLTARSPRYAFILTQTKPDAPWLMKHFTPDPLSRDVLETERHGGGLADASPLGFFWNAAGQTFADLSKQPGFKITQVKAQPDGLTKVEFQWEAKKIPCSGYALTDSRLSSLVRECRIRGQSQSGEFSWELKRQLNALDPKKAIPECKSIEYSSRGPGHSNQGIIEFTDYSYAPLPEEEFSLSHYGIPEPGGPAEKRTPWYLWIAGGAAVCALLAFGFRYLRRRRAAALARA